MLSRYELCHRRTGRRCHCRSRIGGDSRDAIDVIAVDPDIVAGIDHAVHAALRSNDFGNNSGGDDGNSGGNNDDIDDDGDDYDGDEGGDDHGHQRLEQWDQRRQDLYCSMPH